MRRGTKKRGRVSSVTLFHNLYSLCFQSLEIFPGLDAPGRLVPLNRKPGTAPGRRKARLQWATIRSLSSVSSFCFCWAGNFGSSSICVKQTHPAATNAGFYRQSPRATYNSARLGDRTHSFVLAITGLARVPHTASVSAIIGSTLIALLLSGSSRNPASSPTQAGTLFSAEVARFNKQGQSLFAEGHYRDARAAFMLAASRAQLAGMARETAVNWNNAGASSVAALQYKVALSDFARARQLAESSRQYAPLASTLNNLASLYLQMGEPEAALDIARSALDGPTADAVPGGRAKLSYQMADALAQVNRFDEAEPLYRQAISGLVDRGDLDAAARVLGVFGDNSLHAGRLDEAEWALDEGLRLVRIHRLNASASILSGLARLKVRQGDARSAAALFDAALDAPEGLAPRWKIYADRGQFRLSAGNTRGALADFREARRIAANLRADMVPADQDRVALESGLSLVMQGLVDSGNRLAQESGDRAILEETFDAAERDRLWSLRALVPAPDDWRTRLPEKYWETLARYQQLERDSLAQGPAPPDRALETLRLDLEQMEAAAARDNATALRGESPLTHVRNVIDRDSVLLSFHLSDSASWVWAVDDQRVDVYRLASTARLRGEVTDFSAALRDGKDADALGRQLYRELFGAVPESYLRHQRWLLELDGPLHDLPFAALIAGEKPAGEEPAGEKRNEPIYLVERAALQSIPSALLLERGAIPADGAFLGIGDPIYNRADARFRGSPGPSELTLPRLPNTAGELEACSRAWNSSRPRVLTGDAAGMENVRSALEEKPAIIHFATHVVTSPGEYRSGLIALSLDPAGAMGLLGPKEIVAHRVDASLVVMDGCHSAQGEALPSAGLMGLTRAWIGAGARAVMATRWDVPDEAAELFMTGFYTALRTARQRGPAFALREAQLAAIHKGNARGTPGAWAGYFLLSRIQ